MADRIQGFRGEYLWELEIVERQTLALAEAIPAERYEWRPDAKARSVSEVFVHVAAGNFMLLDILSVPAHGPEHFWDLVRHNDQLESSLRDQAHVIELLARSFRAATASVTDAGDAELDRPLHFFGEHTTVRRVYLRMLAHTHEHMGQMIGYLRSMGMNAPWKDWRPDR